MPASARERPPTLRDPVLLAAGALAALYAVSTLPAVRGRAGFSGTWDGVVQPAVYLLLAAAGLRRGRRCAPRGPAWYVLAAGIALYGGGWIAWSSWVVHQHPEPFPSVADALWLSFYPAACAAVVVLLRRGSITVRPSMWVDGAVSGFGVVAFGAALVGPIVHDTHGRLAVVLTNIAYPMGDLLLIALVVAGIAMYGLRLPRYLWVVGAGFVLMILGDATYLIQISSGSYVPGSWLNAVWPMAMLLMVAAAGASSELYPARSHTWPVLAVPIVAVLAAVALMSVDAGGRLTLLVKAFGAATVVAALVRLALTYREATDGAESRRLARTDELTGMPNRRGFYEALSSLLRSPLRRTAAVLLLDLDRFKEVNDTLGHDAGDELLVQVARRLAEVVRADDTLARLGGDEFAVLVANADATVAGQVADRVIRRLGEPYRLRAAEVRIGASVGQVMLDGASAVEMVLRDADLAMYDAKSRGRGCRSVFAPQLREAAGRRMALQADLAGALEAGQLRVVYQPVFDLGSRRCVGAEALLRWRHPTLGLVPPATFIPIAEDSGAIVSLGRWVLEQACRETVRWKALLPAQAEFAVGVNVSVRQLDADGFVADVADVLARTGLPAGALVLEITESVYADEHEHLLESLRRLRRLGVRLALDDFGTGYSSLGYLQRFTVDILKVDRRFVAALDGEADTAVITEAIIGLGRALGLVTVAEGIESAWQVGKVRDLGCLLGQGLALHAPAAPEQVTRLLEDGRRHGVPEQRLTQLNGVGRRTVHEPR